MLDEAHIVAGLDARHGEQRHCAAGAHQGVRPRPFRDPDLHGVVGQPVPVAVDLEGKRRHSPTLVFIHLHVYSINYKAGQ